MDFGTLFGNVVSCSKIGPIVLHYRSSFSHKIIAENVKNIVYSKFCKFGVEDKSALTRILDKVVLHFIGTIFNYRQNYLADFQKMCFINNNI